MLKRIIFFITHPAALALPLSIFIVLLLPTSFNRFLVEEVSTIKESFSRKISYTDLNGDSFSDKVLYNESESLHPIITVFEKAKIVDQWNFKGKLLLNKEYLYFDHDYDGIKEIFVFTIENDSVFFYGINPYKKAEHHFFRKFIYKLSKRAGKYDAGLNLCDFTDVDNNGYKEIIVSIFTGFTLSPRNLFLIDIVNDTVLISPESGTAILDPVLLI